MKQSTSSGKKTQKTNAVLKQACSMVLVIFRGRKRRSRPPTPTTKIDCLLSVTKGHSRSLPLVRRNYILHIIRTKSIVRVWPRVTFRRIFSTWISSFTRSRAYANRNKYVRGVPADISVSPFRQIYTHTQSVSLSELNVLRVRWKSLFFFSI